MPFENHAKPSFRSPNHITIFTHQPPPFPPQQPFQSLKSFIIIADIGTVAYRAASLFLSGRVKSCWQSLRDSYLRRINIFKNPILQCSIEAALLEKLQELRVINHNKKHTVILEKFPHGNNHPDTLAGNHFTFRQIQNNTIYISLFTGNKMLFQLTYSFQIHPSAVQLNYAVFFVMGTFENHYISSV